MKAFLFLPPLMRNLFQLWSLLLCFAAIVCAVNAISQKQVRIALAAVLLFLPCHLLLQFTRDISEYFRTGAGVFLPFAGISFLWYAALMLVLTILPAYLLSRMVRYGKNNITPDSIKLCVDSMPCGICYWCEGGRVIFANTCMAELCFRLLGVALQNGAEFDAAIPEPILPIGDRVWSFTRKTMTFRGEPLHELIATDITELYEKTRTLQAENEEISQYNQALRSYNLRIDETVRQQEILRAKVNIHDEMNKLMLTTVAAGSDGGGSIDDAFALWQCNALLLCREAAGEESTGSIEHLRRIAEALHIPLHICSSLPEDLSERQRSLVFSAAQEALTNDFKHAGGMPLTIDFTKTDSGFRCDFSNRGKLPESPVTFTGGLNNLQNLAQLQGARISVTVSDCFTLSLFLP